MFRNRRDAAIQLADKLDDYRDENPIVFGIARGGVETGYYVAQSLVCDFSVLIVRKLGLPFRPESAFGAIAEDGSIYLNPYAKELVSESQLSEVVKRETAEIDRRVREYRKGEPPPKIKNRTVILVDDGIATGATLFAAIRMCRNAGAGQIVVAAPVSAMDTLKKLQSLADAVIVVETPGNFYAVSQFYEEFQSVTDQDVSGFLKKVAHSPI